MRKNVALVLIGLVLGAVLVSVVPAGAHNDKAIRALKRRVSRLEGRLSCLNSVAPVTQFGSETVGYVWRDSADSEILVPALDFGPPAPDQPPDVWVSLVRPACVQSGGRSDFKVAPGTRGVVPLRR